MRSDFDNPELALRLADEQIKAGRALNAMDKAARDMHVEGVAEIVTLPYALAMAEFDYISVSGLQELTLAQLMAEYSNGRLVHAIFTILVKICGVAFREPDPARISDSGTNRGAYASGKLWQSLRTGADSTPHGVRKGESPNHGAIYHSQVVTAFSGGTEAQDLLIAMKGKDHFVQL